MSAASPSVGIIGLGFGRAHIAAFQARGCSVVAVCQRDAAAARAVAARYGVPAVYDRWEELLDRARPDIVVIATPPHLHHAIATRALELGAHVLCEKPLATTVAEARAMAEAARRAGRVAMTAFNWRFPAATRELAARVASGALGRVFHVAARFQAGRWADAGAVPTWRMDRSFAGHGAMGDMGVHLVDLVRSTFGELRRVVAHSGIAYAGREAPGTGRAQDAEDYCAWLAELEGGAQAVLTATRVAHGVREHTLEAFGSRGGACSRLDLSASRWWVGELRLGLDGAPLAPVALAADAAVTAEDPSDVIGQTTIAPLVDLMLEGIRTGRPPSPSFDDGARAQAVLDAVAESSRCGGWVDVPAA